MAAGVAFAGGPTVAVVDTVRQTLERKAGRLNVGLQHAVPFQGEREKQLTWNEKAAEGADMGATAFGNGIVWEASEVRVLTRR